MPPPSPSERWYTGRHFGIVIDAGSSGSRLQIYSWIDPRISKPEARLPRVEKGTEDSEDWVYKIEPGISTFSENPSGIASYLRPLLHHAQTHIPPSLHRETPLFLLATAGMRLLPPQDQARILEEACFFLTRHSEFKIDGRGEDGPCGKSVRIITGEEEGLFGWIAVNYLVDSFPTSTGRTYGFLDMGGASTQIAFEPSSNATGSPLVDVRLRLLNGDILNHRVFVTTWLGYGTNQARERYVDHLLSSSPTQEEVEDPCLPQNLTLPSSSRTLRGTGSFKSCLNTTLPLLNNTAPCPDSPCLMNGIHVPKIDFSVDHFIGVSEYWFSSEHIFGLGGPYSFVEYESAAVRFCSRPWNDLLSAHEKLVNGTSGDPHLGDGEVEDEEGQIVQVGKWDPTVEISRLEMQCFKAAWIVNVLHEGIGMPRIVDSPAHSNSSEEEGGERIASQASQKGLGRPTFQSADTIGDIAITWTLGKMVLEASKEISGASSASSSEGALKDPLDEEVSQDPNFPIHKINPPWNLNLTSPFGSSSLTSLGYAYPSVILLIWVSIFLVVLVVGAGPVRRTVRGGCLRVLRHLTTRKRRREVYNLNLEEGVPFVGGGGGSPTRTRFLKTISKMFSSSSSSQQNRPERFSPRTFSFVSGNQNPNPNSPNGTEGGLNPTAAASAISTSRSPSPIPVDAETFPGSVPIPFGIGGGGGGNLNAQGLGPRSRNTSQGSLRGYGYSRGERGYRE